MDFEDVVEENPGGNSDSPAAIGSRRNVNKQPPDENGAWACGIPGCNKKFAREADLKRHQRTTKSHSSAGFPCPDCGSKFTRADALRRHHKAKHGGTLTIPAVKAKLATKKKLKTDNDTRSVSPAHTSNSDESYEPAPPKDYFPPGLIPRAAIAPEYEYERGPAIAGPSSGLASGLNTQYGSAPPMARQVQVPPYRYGSGSLHLQSPANSAYHYPPAHHLPPQSYHQYGPPIGIPSQFQQPSPYRYHPSYPHPNSNQSGHLAGHRVYRAASPVSPVSPTGPGETSQRRASTGDGIDPSLKSQSQSQSQSHMVSAASAVHGNPGPGRNIRNTFVFDAQDHTIPYGR